SRVASWQSFSTSDANAGFGFASSKRSIVKKFSVATTATVNVPASQTATQKIAQERAVPICNLLSPDESLRCEVKSFRQRFLDFGPEALHRPLAICEHFRNPDSNSGAVVGRQERFQQRFATLLAGSEMASMAEIRTSS